MAEAATLSPPPAQGCKDKEGLWLRASEPSQKGKCLVLGKITPFLSTLHPSCQMKAAVGFALLAEDCAHSTSRGATAPRGDGVPGQAPAAFCLHLSPAQIPGPSAATAGCSFTRVVPGSLPFSNKGHNTKNARLDTFLLLFKKIQNGSNNSFIIQEIVLP